MFRKLAASMPQASVRTLVSPVFIHIPAYAYPYYDLAP